MCLCVWHEIKCDNSVYIIYSIRTKDTAIYSATSCQLNKRENTFYFMSDAQTHFIGKRMKYTLEIVSSRKNSKRHYTCVKPLNFILS